jgi:hypothetical protein
MREELVQGVEKEQIDEFRSGIFEIAAARASEALNKCSQLSIYKRQSLIDQLAFQAVEKAQEMLGPILSWVRASSLTKESASRALAQHDFSTISEYWESFLSARCAAVDQQLSDAEALLRRPITDIELLDGDPHNGAYQPLKLTVQIDNVKTDFLYKSIDPTPMMVVYQAADIVCEQLGILNFVDKAINSTGFSYVREFTSISKPNGQEEINGYFYAYGAICSIASFLEITDLHFENIIATSAGPKIIDIEFILSNTQYQNTKWTYKNSGLFEPWTSPIGQTAVHQHISPNFQTAGSNIHYCHLQTKRNDSHVIRDRNGLVVQSIDYSDHIRAGALEADAALRDCAEAVNQRVSQLINEKHKIRCFIRGTAYYRILQLQLWFPKVNLAHQIKTTISKLQRPGTISRDISSDTKSRIVDAEMRDLLKGDIPYFWIDGVTGDLMHSTGLISKRFGVQTKTAFDVHLSRWRARTYTRTMAPIIKRMTSKEEWLGYYK